MDHQVFAQLLGNYGEFFGAIAVFGTLFYLATQVRHSRLATETNNQLMEENRKIALVQTYQARAQSAGELFGMLADSPYAPVVMSKLQQSGAESLSAEEHFRQRNLFMRSIMNLDSTYFAYQHGLVDDEYYESVFKDAVRQLAPMWRAMGMPSYRRSFSLEVQRIIEDEG